MYSYRRHTLFSWVSQEAIRRIKMHLTIYARKCLLSLEKQKTLEMEAETVVICWHYSVPYNIHTYIHTYNTIFQQCDLTWVASTQKHPPFSSFPYSIFLSWLHGPPFPLQPLLFTKVVLLSSSSFFWLLIVTWSEFSIEVIKPQLILTRFW